MNTTKQHKDFSWDCFVCHSLIESNSYEEFYRMGKEHIREHEVLAADRAVNKYIATHGQYFQTAIKGRDKRTTKFDKDLMGLMGIKLDE